MQREIYNYITLFHRKETDTMNMLNNIKVAYKILILIVISILGMALIGYRGYSTIQESQASLSSIYQQNMQQIY